MKKLLFFALLSVSLFSFTLMGAKWSVDGAHSRLGFSFKHLGISEMHGFFGKVEASYTAEKEDFSDAVFELTADVSSINTGMEMRDNHLKAEDFFDVAKYPNLTFKSTSVKKKGKDLIVVGDLTMHGVTKSVTLTATLNGTIEHPKSKKQMAGFKVRGKINRTDFGIGASMPDMVVSNEVNLVADMEFSKE